MISAVILAAGESRRMGELKPLSRINGLTFMQHIEQALRRAGIEEIVAVVGFDADKIRRESGTQARFALNRYYAQGQFSSLQIGIRALPPCRGVVVCLADQPQVRSAWIAALVDAFNAQGGLIVRPCFGAKMGHPLLYSAELFPHLLALPPSSSAKTVMEQFAAQTTVVDIASEAILHDADTPDDLRLISRFFESASDQSGRQQLRASVHSRGEAML